MAPREKKLHIICIQNYSKSPEVKAIVDILIDTSRIMRLNDPTNM